MQNMYQESQGYQQNQNERHPFDEQAYQPVNFVDAPPYAQLAQQNPQELFSSPLPHSDVRFVAVLCYSLGWFSGLLFALFTRQSRYVRFHALQSLVFFGAVNVIDVGIISLGFRHMYHFVSFMFGPFLLLGFVLLNIVAFIGWMVAIVQAYKGSYYRLPLVGNIVARVLDLEAPLK